MLDLPNMDKTKKPSSLSFSKWKEQSKWFVYNHYKVCYHTEGKGIPLILIHGFPTASWDWHLVWPVLAKRYRVIAIDMLGFGWSDKPSGYRYSLFDQADLHEALTAHLNISTCHILAHDYGNTVVQELLARQNESVVKRPLSIESVILLNGGLFPTAIHPRPIQKILLGPLGFIVARFITKKIFFKSFSKVFSDRSRPTEQYLSECWSIITHNSGRSIIHQTIQYMRERMSNQARWTTALAEATIPVSFVVGIDDPVSGQDMLDHFKRLVLNGENLKIENCGHYPQIEAAEQIIDYALKFYPKYQPKRIS